MTNEFAKIAKHQMNQLERVLAVKDALAQRNLELSRSSRKKECVKIQAWREHPQNPEDLEHAENSEFSENRFLAFVAIMSVGKVKARLRSVRPLDATWRPLRPWRPYHI